MKISEIWDNIKHKIIDHYGLNIGGEPGEERKRNLTEEKPTVVRASSKDVVKKG